MNKRDVEFIPENGGGSGVGSRRLGTLLPNRKKATSYAWAICKRNEREREKPMAIYITQGRYTPDAVKGMVANPENRERRSRT